MTKILSYVMAIGIWFSAEGMNPNSYTNPDEHPEFIGQGPRCRINQDTFLLRMQQTLESQIKLPDGVKIIEDNVNSINSDAFPPEQRLSLCEATLKFISLALAAISYWGARGYVDNAIEGIDFNLSLARRYVIGIQEKLSSSSSDSGESSSSEE